ncbi:MAG TPA: hypothetical protein VMN99_03640 [Anaerolineales bacterium]|nr:hypothetical protein [Anaerolineales bacterium]
MTPKRWRTLVLGLVTAGVILAGLFGLRTLRALREFQEHREPPVFSVDAKSAETDVELIRDWMTIPFISKIYHVRQQVLFEALEIPEHGNRDKSLRQLNEEYFPETPGIVEATVKVVVMENIPPPMPTVPAP